ncbi:9237_t:CDS:2 [Entrophospora sp. SA101]|nr:9237_t:CDS:2 [Entrophospora sp. SA101]
MVHLLQTLMTNFRPQDQTSTITSFISAEQLNQNNESQFFTKGRYSSLDDSIANCKYDYLYNDEHLVVQSYPPLPIKFLRGKKAYIAEFRTMDYNIKLYHNHDKSKLKDSKYIKKILNLNPVQPLILQHQNQIQPFHHHNLKSINVSSLGNNITCSKGIQCSDIEIKKFTDSNRAEEQLAYLMVIGLGNKLDFYWLVPPQPFSQDKYDTKVYNYHCGQYQTDLLVTTVSLYTNQPLRYKNYHYLFVGTEKGYLDLYYYNPMKHVNLIRRIEATDPAAPITNIIVSSPLSEEQGHLLIVGYGGRNDLELDKYLQIRVFKVSLSLSDPQLLEITFPLDSPFNAIKGRIINMQINKVEGSSICNLSVLISQAEKDDNKVRIIDVISLIRIGRSHNITVPFFQKIDSNKPRLLDITPVCNKDDFTLLFSDESQVLSRDMQLYEREVFIPQEPKFEFNKLFPELSSTSLSGLSSFPFNNATIDGILQRRANMDNQLIIDLLLKFANIDNDLYPPHNKDELKALFDAIDFNTEIDALRQNCLVYYLLKFWRSDKHQHFATTYLIPPNFMNLMDGYWLLDNGNYIEASRFLTDPSVKVDFDMKVLETLFKNTNVQTTLNYAELNGERLESIAEFNDLKQDILISFDLKQAYMFQKKHNNEKQLDERDFKALTKILNYCFFPVLKKDRLNVLLDLTLDESEYEYLQKYCIENAQLDFLVMYCLNHNKLVDTFKYNNMLNQLQTSNETIVDSSINTQKRNEIIRKLWDSLPKQQKEEIKKLTENQTINYEVIDLNDNQMEVENVIDEDDTIIIDKNNVIISETLESSPLNNNNGQISTSPSLLFSPQNNTASTTPKNTKNINIITSPPSPVKVNNNSPQLPNHSPFSEKQLDEIPQASSSSTTPSDMEGMIQHFNDRINDLKDNMMFRIEGSPRNLENVLHELNETIEWINNNLPKHLPGDLINDNDIIPYNNNDSNNSHLNYPSQNQIQQQQIKLSEEETKKEEENPFIMTTGPPLQRNNNNIQKTMKSTATTVLSFITISEYDNLPNKRITRNKINEAIKDFNEVFLEKYNILKSPLSNLNRTEKKKYWVFITEQDLKTTTKKINFKIDNIGRAIITILRHLKKIKEVRGGGHVRYIIMS